MTLALPAAPTRDELVAHLVATRIAGAVATARSSNLANVQKMLDRHPDYWFGVELDRPWTFADVVDVMARRVGIHPDPEHDTVADTIDPQLCADALDAARDRIAAVAAARGTVFCATGHPTGLLALFLPVLGTLVTAGCRVLTPAAEQWVDVAGTPRRIRYVGGVATIGTGGDLLHTHSPDPMNAVLAGRPDRPDLVLADHGWAGAAGTAGWPVVGFADTNDPALFVAAEQGLLEVAVPLDDNVAPEAYVPLAAYLVRGLRRSE